MQLLLFLSPNVSCGVSGILITASIFINTINSRRSPKDQPFHLCFLIFCSSRLGCHCPVIRPPFFCIVNPFSVPSFHIRIKFFDSFERIFYISVFLFYCLVFGPYYHMSIHILCLILAFCLSFTSQTLIYFCFYNSPCLSLSALAAPILFILNPPKISSLQDISAY